MKVKRLGTTIGRLAKCAGVNVETIRFYQRKGLMLEPVKPPRGIRRYEASDLARVRFIKSAQRLGFSLDDIGELLKLEDGTHCEEARQIAELKLADVQRRLSELRTMESTLAGLVRMCNMAQGNVSCPVIASLQGGHAQA